MDERSEWSDKHITLLEYIIGVNFCDLGLAMNF